MARSLSKARRKGALCNKLRGRYDRARRMHKECEAIDDIPCVHKATRQRNFARNLGKREGCKWIAQRGLGRARRQRR